MATGESILFGLNTVETLEQDARFAWFAENYSHNPLETAASDEWEKLKQGFAREDLRLLAFLGTWCPDCHYWVPRLIRLLDELDFPRASVILIGLDRDKSLEPFTSRHRITRLPTFVFLRGETETGRITEEPADGDLLEELGAVLA